MQTILATCTLVVLCATAAFAANAKAGQAIFDKSCKSCHGADGTPNAAVAKMMKVDMKDLKSTEVQSLSDDDMKKIITEGKDKMKPVKTVSGSAVDDVIGYVRSLKK
jgi:mono/diheme cytochrome c family protein